MAIKVLLVEDDQDDIFLIRDYLSQDANREYEIKECGSLETALETIHHESFDVTLLDLGLPDASGMKPLESLSQKENAGPIVVLTINSESHGEQAIQCGAADYLPKKDADSISLTRSIRHAIERHQLLLKLKYKAETDHLTGLANRAMLYDKLDFIIAQCERTKNTFALIMMDFDKFKEINDTKGHIYGDKLLRSFAYRLKRNLRKSDYAARFGGDEFLIIVTNFDDTEHLAKLIEKKQAALSEPYTISIDGEHSVQEISLSTGIMVWEPGTTAQMMLEKADEAMYRSKKDKRNEITLY